MSMRAQARYARTIERRPSWRAADKAHEAGVDVELELWPGVAHVFQIAAFLPESALAIDNIARFVRMRAGWIDAPTGVSI